MSFRFRAMVVPALFVFAACSSSEESPPDASAALDATIAADTGTGFPDAVVQPDAAEPMDAGLADTGADPQDASLPDSGMIAGEDLSPGQHVTFREGRVALGQTFAAVKQTLGPPARRTAGNTNRSYEWMLAGGAQVTVWFANTNLDNDDQPPADVDDTDVVLWIAVTGTFGGTTPTGLGLGSTRAAFETALGVSPNLVPIMDPMGTLATWYTRGILVAFDPNDTARTITISKAYAREPNGEIDIVGGELDFGMGSVLRTGTLLGGGTSMNDVRTLLGPPDVEGEVPLGTGAQQIMLRLFTYSFIGLEIFFTYNGRTALFTSVHAPYYGETGAGTPGLGATRTAFEAHLTQLGFAPAVESNAQPGVFCYKLNDNRAVGATYSSDMPATVSSILVGFPLVQRNCP